MFRITTFNSSRCLTSGAIQHPRFGTEQYAAEYLPGMLVENNSYISKEITYGFNNSWHTRHNTKNPVCSYERSPYLMNISIKPWFPNTQNAEINEKSSSIFIEFESIGLFGGVESTPISSYLNDFYVALYNHKTGKISPLEKLTNNTQLLLGSCDKDPIELDIEYSKEKIEEHYPPVEKDGDFPYSVLLFDPYRILYTPGYISHG